MGRVNFHALCFQASLLFIDLDVREAKDLELQTRARDADARAEGALQRLLKMAAS